MNICEYFCNSCGQIRLSLKSENETIECGNCISKDILKGEVGKLNKDKLKKSYNLTQNKRNTNG